MDERIILFSKEELAINSDEKRIIDFIESVYNMKGILRNGIFIRYRQI